MIVPNTNNGTLRFTMVLVMMMEMMVQMTIVTLVHDDGVMPNGGKMVMRW